MKVQYLGPDARIQDGGRINYPEIVATFQGKVRAALGWLPEWPRLISPPLSFSTPSWKKQVG
jgi:hypothetical protein